MPVYSAPPEQFTRSLLPEITDQYDIGSSTRSLWYNRLFVNFATFNNLVSFLGGFISSASSTVSSDFNVTATTTLDSRVKIGTTTPYTTASLNIEIQNAFDHGIIIQGHPNQDEHLFMLRNNAGDILFDVLANGEVDIRHVATANNELALDIECDAAGFGDVNCLFIDYDTGNLSQGEDEALILLNINRFDSSGGDIHGIECLATTGLATAECMEVGAGVNVLEQQSGTFVDMQNATTTDSGVETNRTAAFTSISVDVTIFPADNDDVIIGDPAKFEEIEFILDTVASGAGINPVFEFSTGVAGGATTYSTFSPTDGTNGMRDSGIIIFSDDDIPSWAVGVNAEFSIRITRTRNNLSTVPIEDFVQISAVSEFSWDKEGTLNVNNVFASSTLIVDGVATLNDLLNLSGFISTASSTISSTLTVSNNLSASSTITVAGQSLLAITSGSVRIGNASPQEFSKGRS